MDPRVEMIRDDMSLEELEAQWRLRVDMASMLKTQNNVTNHGWIDREIEILNHYKYEIDTGEKKEISQAEKEKKGIAQEYFNRIFVSHVKQRKSDAESNARANVEEWSENKRGWLIKQLKHFDACINNNWKPGFSVPLESDIVQEGRLSNDQMDWVVSWLRFERGKLLESHGFQAVGDEGIGLPEIKNIFHKRSETKIEKFLVDHRQKQEAKKQKIPEHVKQRADLMGNLIVAILKEKNKPLTPDSLRHAKNMYDALSQLKGSISNIKRYSFFSASTGKIGKVMSEVYKLIPDSQKPESRLDKVKKGLGLR